VKRLSHLAVLSCTLAVAPLVAAAPEYQITTSGDTNPQDNGWRAINIVASTQVQFDYTSPSYPGVGPVTDGTVEAWQVSDPNANVSAAYWATGVPASNSSGNRIADHNWRFSAYVKALPTDGSANARLNAAMKVISFERVIVGAVSSTYSHTLTLENLADGGTELMINSDPNAVVSLSDDYNWVEMIYTAAEGTADVFVNGRVELEDLAGRSIVNNQGNRVEFGDIQLVNGGAGGANWAFAEFVLDEGPLAPIGVPEPASLALFAAGSAMLLGRRRGHA
jgi:hypothetical protein